MNPAELAYTYAEELQLWKLERDEDDDTFEVNRFVILTGIAKYLELLNKPYIVKAQSAIALPRPDKANQYSELSFMGEFSGYDVVTPPRSLGHTAIGGLYLKFRDVIVLSEAEPVETSLFIAPLSAESVEKLAA